MRRVTRETPQWIVSPLQPLESFVEDARQLPDLVCGIIDSQTLTQAFRRDLLRLARHSAQRRESPTRQSITSKTGESERDREAHKQHPHQIRELAPQWFLRVRQANQDESISDSVAAANQANPGPVGQPGGPLRVAALPLAPLRGPATGIARYRR